MLFIGTGDTILDDHFKELWKNDDGTHYVLVRSKDAKETGEKLKELRNMRVISYGKGFSDLVPFLERLIVE